MKKARWFAVASLAAMVCALSIAAGCGGEGGSAGEDPVARNQTQADAKSAMEANPAKGIKNVSSQESARSAMEAAGKKQRKGR